MIYHGKDFSERLDLLFHYFAVNSMGASKNVSLPSYHINTTLIQFCFYIGTLKQHYINVISTHCISWVET